MTFKLNPKRVASIVALLLVPIAAWAVNQATQGAGEDLYTFVVTDLLGGPIGLVAGILCVGYGAYNIVGRSQFAMGVPALLGGVMLLKLDSIVQSFGAMLS